MKDFLYKKALLIDKRYRIGISAVFMTILMFVSTFFPFEKGVLFLPVFVFAVYGATYFAVLEGIEKVEWLTLFIIPILLTISFLLFYFLFPGRWITRIPFLIVYAISLYAMLLCSNIFNVGVEKSLQLYRAAFSVNFFFHSLIMFLVFNILLSVKLDFYINFLITGIVSFVMGVQLFWSIRLKHYFEREVVLYALFFALVLAEIALVLSFVPLNTSIFALFLAASYYSLSGLIYTYLDQRLFKETVREYLIVWGLIFLMMVLSVNW
jgi:hypothetical protein